MSELPCDYDSGMSCSTQTNIIAPAAKARAYGKIIVTWDTSKAPKAAPTISTKADA